MLPEGYTRGDKWQRKPRTGGRILSAGQTAAWLEERSLEDKIMIETAEQLYQAIEQMGRMQRILESYRNEILTQHPRNFAGLAEGPLEQLRLMQAQIEEYFKQWEPAATPVGS